MEWNKLNGFLSTWIFQVLDRPKLVVTDDHIFVWGDLDPLHESHPGTPPVCTRPHHFFVANR